MFLLNSDCLTVLNMLTIILSSTNRIFLSKHLQNIIQNVKSCLNFIICLEILINLFENLAI